MALFPSYTDIPYANPVTEEMQHKTLFSNFDNLGEERRKRKWLYPKRNITLQYNYLTLVNGRTLFDFYNDRNGAYEAFTFFKYEVETFTGEYVGTGDGSTVLFNLPCKFSSARTLYSDNTTLTEGPTGVGDYSYSALGGTDGCDEITMYVAPTSGKRITLDFSGKLKIRCRFKEDNMSFDTFFNRLRTFGIQLQGLLNG